MSDYHGQSHDLFATCPKGIEGLLREELLALGAAPVKETVAGCGFSGSLETAYRVCLWSRFATQVLLPLGHFPCDGPDALYAGARDIDWTEHLGSDATFAVNFGGTIAGINNTQYGAQRVKDAVVDICRERTGERPNVDRSLPQIRIAVRGLSLIHISEPTRL